MTIKSSAKLRVKLDEAKIDAIVADLDQCRFPGAAVGISIQSKPIYRKGFGLANMELPVVLSPSIRMRIGSATKQFTSLAYMLLCEEGKTEIDDPIDRWLPELNPISRSVTFRHVMGHQSGLRDAFDVSFYFNGMGRMISADNLMSMYCSIQDVNAMPGTVWDYNNGGYLILSAAIERIANRPLEDVLRERVFEPVGMCDTILHRSETDFVPNCASPHMIKMADFISSSIATHVANISQTFERSYFGTDFAGAGAMVSTIDDMLRWMAHMDAPAVGTDATWQAMRSPQVLSNGASTGYGLGLVLGQYRGIDTVGHAGGWIGGNAQMLKVPAAGLDVTVMVNRQDVSAAVIVNKIVDLCIQGLDPDVEMLKSPIATGTFRSPTTGSVIQLFATNKQQVVSINGCDWPYDRGQDGVLRPIAVWSHIKQEVTLEGDVESPSEIQLSDFGNKDRLIRTSPPESTAGERIAGRYRSNTIGCEIKIYQSDDGFRLVTAGPFGSEEYYLECLAPGIWRANRTRGALAAILTFEGDEQSLRFDSYHTWAVIFDRCT